jgi:hypothetical protein
MIDVIRSVPIIKVIRNSKNAPSDAGSDKPIGSGSKNATIVTGIARKHTLARRVDITFEYHML